MHTPEPLVLMNGQEILSMPACLPPVRRVHSRGSFPSLLILVLILRGGLNIFGQLLLFRAYLVDESKPVSILFPLGRSLYH